MKHFLPILLVIALTAGCDVFGSDDPDFNQVTVESITVKDLPFTNAAGEAWDFGSGPDVYFQVVNSTGGIEQTSGFINDVGPINLPLTFSNSSFTVTDLSEQYAIDLRDSDNNADDFIGGIEFTFDTDDYPETTTLETADLQYTLELEWDE